MDKADIYNMIESDFDRVFFELGCAYYRSPNYNTMHNFGTLISKYGKEIVFCSKKNIPFAKELLLGAYKEKPSVITAKELGDLLLDLKKYQTAVRYYNEVLRSESLYETVYNLSICYHCLNQYDNLKNLLKSAFANKKFNATQISCLQEFLGLVAGVHGDCNTAAAMLKELQKNTRYENNPETIKIAYLCGDNGFILKNYKAVFADWGLETVDYQILKKVFDEHDPEHLKEFDAWIKHAVFDFYMDNPEFPKNQELISAIETKNSAPNIKLLFSPEFSCDFY